MPVFILEIKKEPMMKALALDLGMIYGYAVYIVDNLKWGYNDVTPTRFASQQTSAVLFRRHLLDLNEEIGGIEAIFFEEVHGSKGQYAIQINGMFIGVMLSVAEEINCKIIKGFQVGEIKRFATNSAIAGKDEMIAAAVKRWGVDLDKTVKKDANIADALFILALGLKTLYGIRI